MGKGILLEVEGRTGVILTPKGEFRRVPLPQGSFDVGEEIAYEEGGQRTRWGWLVAAAAVALLLLSPVGYRQWALAQPLALVMIDINPSIQLTLNGREQVIDAQGLNEDGQQVLDGLAWQKRPLDEVTRAITSRAVAAGMLDPAGEASTVVVAVAPVAERALSEEQALEITAASKVAVQEEVRVQAEAQGMEPKAQVAAVEATYEEVREAREQGITLPKLIILQELQAERPELDIEDLKDRPPGQIMKDLGVSPGDLFGKAEEHRKSGKKPKDAPANSSRRATPVDGEDPDDSDGEDEDRSDRSNSERRNDDEDRRVPPGRAKRDEERDSIDFDRAEKNGRGNSDTANDRVPPGQEERNGDNDSRESEKDARKADKEAEKDSRRSEEWSDRYDRGSNQPDRGSGDDRAGDDRFEDDRDSEERDEKAGESEWDSSDSPRPGASGGAGGGKDDSRDESGSKVKDDSKENGRPRANDDSKENSESRAKDDTREKGNPESKGRTGQD